MNLFGKNEAENLLIDSLKFHKKHKDLNSIYNEVDSLQLDMMRKGYITIKTDSIIRESERLFIGYLNLGVKAKTHIIYYDTLLSKNNLEAFRIERSNLTDMFIEIPFEQTEHFLNQLIHYFEEKGDVFAEVQLENIDFKNETLKSSLAISTTKNRTIDAIVIKGYEKFPKSFVKYGIKLKKGTVFNKNNVIKASSEVSQLGFVNEIKPPEVLFTKDSTTVFLYLEKKKTNYFDGFLGFSTNEETNKLKLNGYLDVRLNNNLNAGEELMINWKDNGSKQTTFLADITIPYISKSRFGANANLSIFKQDSTFANTTTSINLNYNWSFNSYLSFGIAHLESNHLLSSTASDIADFKAFFYKFHFNKRIRLIEQFLLNNKLLIDIRFLIGKRISDDKKANQQKIIADISYQFRLDRRNYIFVGNTANFLISDTYFTNEKFWFGGINSIRGFNENSIRATFFNVINTEYRYLLSNSLYINSIIDFGYVEDKQIDKKNTLSGLGLGFGIKTSGGFLKINYAVGKFDNAPLKLSNTNVHLSFSTFF